MKPWIRTYLGRCLEIRFGAFGWQAGLTAPNFSAALWRNRDLARVASFRWGRWMA